MITDLEKNLRKYCDHVHYRGANRILLTLRRANITTMNDLHKAIDEWGPVDSLPIRNFGSNSARVITGMLEWTNTPVDGALPAVAPKQMTVIGCPHCGGYIVIRDSEDA